MFVFAESVDVSHLKMWVYTQKTILKPFNLMGGLQCDRKNREHVK